MKKENKKKWEKEFEEILDDFEVKLKGIPRNILEGIAYSNPKNVLMANVRLLLQQAREEERERIIKKIEYLVNRAEGENKMIPPKLLRDLFLTPAK